jgi:S1-C subfamily serine protease
MFKLDINSLEWRLRLAQQAPAPTPEPNQEQPQKIHDPIFDIIQKSLQSSCTIFVKSGRKQWTGSGFHLGNGYIATAGHVVPPELQGSGAEISATFDGKVLFPMQFVISDPSIDSGIIYNAQVAKTIPAANLADSNRAQLGDIVAVISSPEGWHDTATVGRISNVHQSMGENAPSQAWNDIIFIDADILQGSSGGMAIGTDGLIYGSIMGVTGQHADIGIGERAICPANKIQRLLQSIQK